MAELSPKISEAILAQSEPFISIEFFPPKTADVGIASLNNVITKLKVKQPLFADFTWGAGGTTSDLTLQLCINAKVDHHLNPNMHLTCTNMELSKIDAALSGCKQSGITNILALRGDPPVGTEKWTATEGGLTCALDLVRYIREQHGDFFSISVAGYPEGHPTSMSVVQNIDDLSPSEKKRCNTIVDPATGVSVVSVCRDEDFKSEMNYLKEKVDAGAQFIITQMVFDAGVYADFVTSCREIGITVPILPGIMCITSYGGFKRMTAFCKSRVPDSVVARIEAVKDDEKAMKELGIQLGVELCRDLLAAGSPGLHFYTLNLANTTIAIINDVFPDRGAVPDTAFSFAATAAASAQGPSSGLTAGSTVI